MCCYSNPPNWITSYLAELPVSASLWIRLCGEKLEAPVGNGISSIGPNLTCDTVTLCTAKHTHVVQQKGAFLPLLSKNVKIK